VSEIPRYAIVPTHDRPKWLLPLVASLGPSCDAVVVVDNASDPPVDEAALNATGARVHVIRDEEQPPHLSRFWNVAFDRCAALAAAAGVWDVAVLNDDVLIPAGWLEIVADGLREHPTAAVAHTGTGRRIRAPELRLVLDNELDTRMCPHAFVVRGEIGLRADESMRWWYFDSDFDWSARLAGGVLTVPGPVVTNALANFTTVGVLREQADLDCKTFEAKWA
jgi:hypothetical protein